MYTIVYLESVVIEDIASLPILAKRRIKNAIEKKLITNPIEFGKPLQYSLKSARRL